MFAVEIYRADIGQWIEFGPVFDTEGEALARVEFLKSEYDLSPRIQPRDLH